MGHLICAGIAPHGFSVIGEIAGDEYKLFKRTRDAMEAMGKNIIKDHPDTIIVLTPHGLRLKGFNAIYTSENCRGSLAANGEVVELAYACDKEMALEILEAVDMERIPSVGCNFGGMTGEASNIEMDWGTIIPLWFCQEEGYHPKIVVIGPTREIEPQQLIRLGEIIGEVVSNSTKSVALIASADQGHCHNENGPYGFNPASKIYDKQINDIIENNNMDELLKIDSDLIENAKPDSFWQMLILHGAIKDLSMTSELLSYQVPTYFGMSVASFHQ